eukprot:ctg_2402.g756
MRGVGVRVADSAMKLRAVSPAGRVGPRHRRDPGEERRRQLRREVCVRDAVGGGGGLAGDLGVPHLFIPDGEGGGGRHRCTPCEAPGDVVAGVFVPATARRAGGAHGPTSISYESEREQRERGAAGEPAGGRVGQRRGVLCEHHGGRADGARAGGHGQLGAGVPVGAVCALPTGRSPGEPGALQRVGGAVFGHVCLQAVIVHAAVRSVLAQLAGVLLAGGDGRVRVSAGVRRRQFRVGRAAHRARHHERHGHYGGSGVFWGHSVGLALVRAPRCGRHLGHGVSCAGVQPVVRRRDGAGRRGRAGDSRRRVRVGADDGQDPSHVLSGGFGVAECWRQRHVAVAGYPLGDCGLGHHATGGERVVVPQAARALSAPLLPPGAGAVRLAHLVRPAAVRDVERFAGGAPADDQLCAGGRSAAVAAARRVHDQGGIARPGVSMSGHAVSERRIAHRLCGVASRLRSEHAAGVHGGLVGSGTAVAPELHWRCQRHGVERLPAPRHHLVGDAAGGGRGGGADGGGVPEARRPQRCGPPARRAAGHVRCPQQPERPQRCRGAAARQRVDH